MTAAHAQISTPDLRDVLNGQVITPDTHPTRLRSPTEAAVQQRHTAMPATTQRTDAQRRSVPAKRKRAVNPIAGHPFGQLPERQR
jgi:hypothetical protein